MKRRTLAKTAATLAAAFLGGKAAAQTEAKKPCACAFRQSGNNITLYVDGAKKTKVMFVADTHISYSDGLVEPYLDYAYRMHRAFASEPKMEALSMSLKSAKKSGCELAILGGDIINFPSEYNVKKLNECMANSEIPCRYIAGNHDWHFEGSGPDIPQPELRRRWIKKARAALRGRKSRRILGAGGRRELRAYRQLRKRNFERAARVFQKRACAGNADHSLRPHSALRSGRQPRILVRQPEFLRRDRPQRAKRKNSAANSCFYMRSFLPVRNARNFAASTP